MEHFKVTLTQAYIRYSQVVVDVQAVDGNAAGAIARNRAKEMWWRQLDGDDTGCLDIVVENDAGGATGWRLD
jgi:hypothetical protein